MCNCCLLIKATLLWSIVYLSVKVKSRGGRHLPPRKRRLKKATGWVGRQHLRVNMSWNSAQTPQKQLWLMWGDEIVAEGQQSGTEHCGPDGLIRWPDFTRSWGWGPGENSLSPLIDVCQGALSREQWVNADNHLNLFFLCFFLSSSYPCWQGCGHCLKGGHLEDGEGRLN